MGETPSVPQQMSQVSGFLIDSAIFTCSLMGTISKGSALPWLVLTYLMAASSVVGRTPADARAPIQPSPAASLRAAIALGASRGRLTDGLPLLQLLHARRKLLCVFGIEKEKALILAVDFGDVRLARVIGHRECRNLAGASINRNRNQAFGVLLIVNRYLACTCT